MVVYELFPLASLSSSINGQGQILIVLLQVHSMCVILLEAMYMLQLLIAFM